MKSKITNRCLSLLLTICLVAALIPASAFAQEVPQTAETTAATEAAEDYTIADTADTEKDSETSEENDLAASNRNYYKICFERRKRILDDLEIFFMDANGDYVFENLTVYAKPGEKGIYWDKKCTQKIDKLDVRGYGQERYVPDTPRGKGETFLKWRVSGNPNQTYGKQEVCEVKFTGDTKLYPIFSDSIFPATQKYNRYRYIGYAYDENGKLLTTTYYDKDGRILKLINHFTGGTKIAQYDDNGSLIAEFTAEGYATTYDYEYKYNAAGTVVSKNMVKKTYPNGTTDQFTYDKNKRITSHTHRSGLKEEYEYDKENNMTRKATYDSKGKLLKEEVKTYRRGTNTITVTTTYEDGRKSVEETVECDGNAKIVLTFNPADEKNTKRIYTYNDKGYLTETKDPYNNITFYEYDSKGNLTAVKTQAAGSKVVVTNMESKYEYDFTRDGVSYLKRITKREGEAVGEEKYANVYEYDEDGHLIKLTDPNGNETQYKYEDGIHLTKVISISSTTRKETNYIYDKAGRLKEIENADGSRNVFEYDKDDRKVKEILIGDGVKVIKRYEYDCMNRVVAVYNTDSKDAIPVSRYEYYDSDNVIVHTDAKGNSTKYTYDALGNLLTEKDPMGNKRTYTYNSDGQITSISDGNDTVVDKNGTVTLVYDKAGNVISATDKKGNTTGFTYDNNNLQTSTTVKAGDKEIVTKFEYDVYGNVTTITMPNNGVVTNTYNKSNQVTSTTDALGFTEYREYDQVGNLKKETDRNENITEYSYDDFNRLIQVKDALGALNYIYDSQGRLTGAEAVSNDGMTRISQGTVTYDAAGRVKSYANALAEETGSKNKVTYEYDGMGRVSKETYEDGQSYTAYEYDNNGNVLTKTYVSKGKTYTYKYEYDDNNRVTTVCDPTGIKTAYAYTWSGLVKMQTIKDEAGNVLSRLQYTYDANENVISVKDHEGHEIHYTYDERNQVKTVKDERGYIYSYSYDESGNLREVVNPDNSKESYTYDLNNNLKTSTLCEKYTTGYEYDANGNLTKITDPGETAVEYTYDSRNRKTTEKNSAGGIVSYTYDILNRVTQVKVSDSGYPGIVRMDEAITTYEYDAKGRIVKITDAEGNCRSFVYDEMDCVTQETDENGNTTRYKYDGLGNIVRVTDSLGNVQKYSYDLRGNCTSYTDEEGRKYTYEYDGLNRMISQTDPKGYTRYYKYDSRGNVTWEMDENGNETAYVYDKSGNVVEKKDALRNITRISYDSMNRPESVTQVAEDGEEKTLVEYTYDERGLVKSETNVQGKTKSYDYDANGNLTLKVDENGNKTQYSYDNGLNLISSINYGSKQVTFAYDAAGNLRQMSDRTGTTTIGVDLLGRINQVKNPSGDTVSYTYDNVGNLIFTAYSGDNGAEVNYEYDSENRLVSIKDNVAGETTLSYDRSGMLIEKTFENGEIQEYTYDSRGYISQLDEFTAEGQRYRTTYKYDPAGNRTRTVRYAYNSDTGLLEQEKYEHYEYDGLNRVGYSEDSIHSKIYEYDGFGNLIREGTTEEEIIYKYNAWNQLVEKKDPDGKERYTYDNAGNRISMTTKEGTFRYYYDTENRLEEVYTPDGQYERYVYNGLGMRTERISSEKGMAQPLREEYVVDFTSGENNDLYVYVTGDSGEYIKRYVYAQGERIAQVTDDPTGKIERLLYVHEDIMGSMSYMTGKDASLYARTEYKLWGEPEVSKDILKDKAVDIYFTGHPYDEMTGMYFAEARFYDPDTRSFISVDPAKDGINWYQYCGANPATYWDPTGLSIEDWQRDGLVDLMVWCEGPMAELYRSDLEEQAEWLLKNPEMVAKQALMIGTMVATTILAMTMPISLPMVISGMCICAADNALEYVLEQSANGEKADNGQLVREVAKGALEGALMGFGGTELVDLAEATRLLKPLEMCETSAKDVAMQVTQITGRWAIGTAGAFGVGVATEFTENLIGGKSLEESLSETFQNSGSILFNAALMAVSDVAVKAMRAPKCFTAGTLVLTEEGLVAIEEIQAGDKVLAFDEETGEIAYKEVVQTFENTTDGLTYVTVETEEGDIEIIESTPGHPYYVKEEKEFVKAYLLEEGTVLTLADGRTAYVKEVVTEELTEPVAVYNFEVADFHTYYVGENSVLVHNTGECGVGEKEKIIEDIKSNYMVKDAAVDVDGLKRFEVESLRNLHKGLKDMYDQFDLPLLRKIECAFLGENIPAAIVSQERTLFLSGSYDTYSLKRYRDSCFNLKRRIDKREGIEFKIHEMNISRNGNESDKIPGRNLYAEHKEYKQKIYPLGFEERFIVADDQVGVIYHEMGHLLHFEAMADAVDVARPDGREHINCLGRLLEMIDYNMSAWNFKISMYAESSKLEYMAECMAAYMKGIQIDKFVERLFSFYKKEWDPLKEGSLDGLIEFNKN